MLNGSPTPVARRWAQGWRPAVRRPTAELGLRGLGLDGFEVVIGWEDTVAHKPEPEPVQWALERMAAAPADAIFVGDSAWDVRAGRAAGVATAAVLWGAGSRE